MCKVNFTYLGLHRTSIRIQCHQLDTARLGRPRLTMGFIARIVKETQHRHTLVDGVEFCVVLGREVEVLYKVGEFPPETPNDGLVAAGDLVDG